MEQNSRTRTRARTASAADGGARAARAQATRAAVVDAAERLFAEHGVAVVSNRQVGEAAGQGNTAVVGYHFGSRTELIRAIAQRHNTELERLRAQMIEELGERPTLRDWVACLVQPSAEHHASLGSPSWYARFGAQVSTDPVLRAIMSDEAMTSPSLQRILVGLNRCLPALSPEVRAERGNMSRLLIVHVFAERERALAEGAPVATRSWFDVATGLVDAIVGIYRAPVTETAGD